MYALKLLSDAYKFIIIIHGALPLSGGKFITAFMFLFLKLGCSMPSHTNYISFNLFVKII